MYDAIPGSFWFERPCKRHKCVAYPKYHQRGVLCTPLGLGGPFDGLPSSEGTEGGFHICPLHISFITAWRASLAMQSSLWKREVIHRLIVCSGLNMITELSFWTGDMTGSELRSLRMALGYSQAELAVRIGLTRVFVGLMERGVKPVSARTQVAVETLRPKPLNFIPSEFNPYVRKIEQALIDCSMSYSIDHIEGDDLTIFYVDDLPVKLIYKPDYRSFDNKNAYIDDNIVIQGRSSVNLICKLLRGARIVDIKSIES